MTTLSTLAAISRRVAATRSRITKIQELASGIRLLQGEELLAGVLYLAGEIRQARIGLGGALLGTGAVLAMGCTIGQGISGFSTLAVGSIITFFSIVTGSVLTMKYQYWRMMQET